MESCTAKLIKAISWFEKTSQVLLHAFKDKESRSLHLISPIPIELAILTYVYAGSSDIICNVCFIQQDVPLHNEELQLNGKGDDRPLPVNKHLKPTEVLFDTVMVYTWAQNQMRALTHRHMRHQGMRCWRMSSLVQCKPWIPGKSSVSSLCSLTPPCDEGSYESHSY